MPSSKLYPRHIKPALDRAAAAVAIVVCMPILLAISWVVRVKLGSPILFCQTRPGIGGRPFTLYKFRSMTNARDRTGRLLDDDRRLTRFGRWLRSTSLDELPELWNVVRGEMSFVGPRPLLVEYLPRYSAEQARRHEVKPGITGWAQINGRNAISWDKRFEHDVWYVDNISFVLDVKILFRTVLAVLSRKGISANRHATMPQFETQSAIDAVHEQAA
jgi:lipopolysaccharide/colanic/teichoic acid biosynthesis glycosyltransferase